MVGVGRIKVRQQQTVICGCLINCKALKFQQALLSDSDVYFIYEIFCNFSLCSVITFFMMPRSVWIASS